MRPCFPKRKRGQAPPGFSLDVDDNKVPDNVIVFHLKNYRQDPFLKTEGSSKKLSQYLRQDHHIIVNHKKVARICKTENLLLKRRQKKKSKFVKIAQNHQVNRENQVWEFDIKYGYLHGEKRFFFLLAFIDVFTRKIKNWYVGRHCKAQDVLDTLSIGISNNKIEFGNSLVIRSDNGSQMRANLFAQGLKDLPAEHEFIPIRTPNKNAHIESFFSIYDLHLQAQYFWNLNDAYDWTIEFIDFYNNRRIHGSLTMSPDKFTKLTELHGGQQYAQAI